MKRQVITCAMCATQFDRRPGGPIPRYCSASCRAKACTERAKQDGRYDQWQGTMRERRMAARVLNPCPYCGTTMDNPRRVQCGTPECERQHTNRRMADFMRKRRALKRTTTVEPIAAHDIYQRDKWTCGICWQPVDPELAWPDPHSASLDHIVPLAHGGTHTAGNVQLAHHRCNSLKRDKPAERLPFAA